MDKFKLISFCVAIVAFLSSAASSQAATIGAATCSQADVQTAVNAAASGDTVSVPAGSCAWLDTVRITNKSITLQGAGETQTIIDDQTIGGFEKQAIIINGGTAYLSRITGFKFLEHNRLPQEYDGIILVKGGTEFRIDHNTFYEVDDRCINVGYGKGVIDHNTFSKMRGPAIMTAYKRDAWGDYSWATPSTFGQYADGMIFIEDNTFAWDEALRNSGEHHDSCIDNEAGARWVFRHNTSEDMAIMTHGIDGGGRYRGLRQFELYDNTFTTVAESNRNGCIYGILIRGGTGTVFNNTLAGPHWQWLAKINLDMEGEGQNDYPGAVTAWGADLCSGTNPYDPPGGYPCIDQAGFGQDNGAWSGNPAMPQSFNETQSEPVYFWNNTVPGGVEGVWSTTTKVEANRDYFSDTEKPGYTPYTYPHPLTLSGGQNTYTVCSSGCDSATIQNIFSSHDLGPDDIVEVRADTPGGSKTYTETVNPGADDYGAEGHPLIIRARTGDEVIIDGQDVRSYGVHLNSSNHQYITIDGFDIRGYTYAGIYIIGPNTSSLVSNITVQNCDLYSYSENSTGLFGINLYKVSNVTVRNNTVHISNIEQMQQTDCFINAVAHDIVYDGNICWDQNPYVNPATGHNDGFQVIGGNGSEYHPLGATYNFTLRNNILIHDQAANDSKQLIYFEYEVGGINQFYNNVIYCTVGSNSNLVSIANKGYGTAGSFEFYNNTLRSTRGTLFITDTGISDVTFKNNIVQCDNTETCVCVYVQNAGVGKAGFDNNQYYSNYSTPFRDSVGFKAWGQWTAAGWDNDYGNWGDASFISKTSYPYDLRVEGGSLAIDDGASLALFSSDILGISRPQGSAWDIGAYEYAEAGGDTTPPAAPQGLAVL